MTIGIIVMRSSPIGWGIAAVYPTHANAVAAKDLLAPYFTALNTKRYGLIWGTASLQMDGGVSEVILLAATGNVPDGLDQAEIKIRFQGTGAAQLLEDLPVEIFESLLDAFRSGRLPG